MPDPVPIATIRLVTWAPIRLYRTTISKGSESHTLRGVSAAYVATRKWLRQSRTLMIFGPGFTWKQNVTAHYAQQAATFAEQVNAQAAALVRASEYLPAEPASGAASRPNADTTASRTDDRAASA